MRTSLPLAGAVVFLSALASGLGASCADDIVLKPLCSTDLPCIESHDNNVNWYCTDRGQCACKNDDACLATEHCNPLTEKRGDGQCHPDRLCELNSDCGKGESCGPDGVCRVGCINDLQCQIGWVCDLEQNTCVPGCWTDGDCELKQACMCKDGEGQPTFCDCDEPDHAGCPKGDCSDDYCPDKTYCKYGDLCYPDDDGLKRCVEDDRGNYCDECQLDPGDPGSGCGSSGPDFCLIDTSDPARRATFCGVDCDQEQECPNGYSCNDVLVLTRRPCGSAAQCTPSADADRCDTEDDCPPGARCSNGRCAGICVGSEGGTIGFCTCVADGDCPEDTCGTGNRCRITRRSCFDDQDCAILCVNDGNIGYCRIGRNCTPENGLNCGEIRMDGEAR